MASLTELLALQRRQRSPYEKPNAMASTLEGILMGMGLASDQKRVSDQQNIEMRNSELNRYVKMLDYQERMARIEAERDNQVKTKRLAQLFGLLPYDEEEQMAGRSMANDLLSKPVSEKPAQVTNVGKMSSMMEEFSPSLTIGKGGMQLTLRKREKKTQKPSMSQAANVAKSREALARNIYNRDHPHKQGLDLMDRPIPYNPTSYELKQSGAYQAADDLLKNFMSGFDGYAKETGGEDFILKDEDLNDF